MQALGFIETRGLIVAIESADVMLKAAEVTLIEKTNVGGGLVSITITGDVASVQAAVEAGAAAVRQLKSESLVSQHVIPRPHKELDSLIGESIENGPIVEMVVEDLVIEDTKQLTQEIKVEKVNKISIDGIVLENGLQEALEFLNIQTVTILRKLAREYKKLGLAGKAISKANKESLLSEFKKYYNN